MAHVQRRRRTSRQETQRQLVDAAGRVVAKHGLRGATVEAITSEAGLTSGALYSNFKTKEDLFLRLFEDKVGNRVSHLAGIVETNDGAEAALDAIVEDEARLLADRDWFVMYIEFVLYAARTPTFAKRFAAARRELLTERVQGVRAAVEKWVERESLDIERLVRTGHALTYGMALHDIVDRRSVAEADVAAGLRDLFTGHFGGSGHR